jgi:hypothetical protein
MYYTVHQQVVFFLLLVGWDYVPCTAATSGLLYQPKMMGEGDCGAICGIEDWQGKPKYSEKTYLSATTSR